MNYWLMKSEPDAFSIDDLKNSYNQIASWDGVRNYQARNMLKNQMKKGDLSFFYHSNCNPPGIIGIMEIFGTGLVDTSAFDPHSPYYDPKSNIINPRWFMVDVRFIKKFARLISLEELRSNPKLVDMPLLRKGNRLSVMPVTEQQWHQIIETYEK